MPQTRTSKPETSRPMSEPEPKFPAQSQSPPGLEENVRPAPRWRAERYRPADKLKDQVALITGGDSGIGRAVAYLYAREGADVAFTYLPSEQTDADATCAAVEEVGRRCLPLAGDLVEDDFCNRAVSETVETLGRLDILVHNAAWQQRKRVTELSEEELDRTIKTNVYAYIRLVRAAVPHMQPASVILATGSVVGLRGSDRLSDYAATKGAIHSVTMAFAQELLDKGIRANCIAPGPVWTPLNIADTGMSAEGIREFGRETGPSQMERPAQPEEIAPAFVFLASEADSSFINGIVLPITGGPA